MAIRDAIRQIQEQERMKLVTTSAMQADLARRASYANASFPDWWKYLHKAFNVILAELRTQFPGDAGRSYRVATVGWVMKVYRGDFAVISITADPSKLRLWVERPGPPKTNVEGVIGATNHGDVWVRYKSVAYFVAYDLASALMMEPTKRGSDATE